MEDTLISTPSTAIVGGVRSRGRTVSLGRKNSGSSQRSVETKHIRLNHAHIESDAPVVTASDVDIKIPQGSREHSASKSGPVAKSSSKRKDVTFNETQHPTVLGRSAFRTARTVGGGESGHIRRLLDHDGESNSSSEYEVVTKKAPFLSRAATQIEPDENPLVHEDMLVQHLTDLREQLTSTLKEHYDGVLKLLANAGSHAFVVKQLDSHTERWLPKPVKPVPLRYQHGTSDLGQMERHTTEVVDQEEDEAFVWGQRHIVGWHVGREMEEDIPLGGNLKDVTEFLKKGGSVQRFTRTSIHPESLKACISRGSLSASESVRGFVGGAVHEGQAAGLMHACGCLHRCAAAIVLSPFFDYGFGALVVANAITTGVSTQQQSVAVDDDTLMGFHILELFFFVMFMLEFILRTLTFGRLMFRKNWRWNLFDFLSLVSQMIEIGGEAGQTNISFIRILRTLRLIRVLRLMRILRLIGELRTLVTSIVSSLKSLVWAVLLLVAFIYVVGIYLTQVVLRHRIEARARQEPEPSTELIYAWGTLARSMWSLFHAVTGGVNWYDVCTPLEKEIGQYMSFVFGFYISFCLLCLLNVITGVFVESALLSAHADKETYIVNHLRSLFMSLDCDNSGTVGWDEFSQMLHTKEMKEVFKQVDIDMSEAKALFRLLDMSGNGSIAIADFISGCNRLRGPAKSLELTILHRETLKLADRFQKHAKLMDFKVMRIDAYLQQISAALIGTNSVCEIDPTDVGKDAGESSIGEWEDSKRIEREQAIAK